MNLQPSLSKPGPRLWLVRHAESQAQTGEQLSIDADLSELGRQQAARLKAPLANVEFDAVFVSPLKRARQTFELSGASCAKGSVRFDSRIVEAMQPGGYLPILPYGPLPAYGSPDGFNAWESDLLRRTRSFFRDLEELPETCGNILVVSHAMAINLIFSVFMDIDFGDPYGFRNCRPGNASVSILEKGPGSSCFDTLRVWNLQSHLEGLPGPHGPAAR